MKTAVPRRRKAPVMLWPTGMVEASEARTLSAIRTALSKVPFYAKQRLPLPSEGASLDDALSKLPILTPAKVRPTLPKAWVPEGHDLKAELASGAIAVIETGLGDSRVRVLFDQAWWRDQERRALALHPVVASAIEGELGPYRDAVLGVPERGTGSCGQGDPAYGDRLEGTRLHLNSRQDPTFWSEAVMTRMLDELETHQTVGLLADPFYLDVLARHASTVGRTLAVRSFIALTRALAIHPHIESIAQAFSGSLLRVYGAREVGTLFVEGEDGNLHHAPFAAHVELLRAKVPTPGAHDVAMVVVTSVDRTVQPWVRYAFGDLVQIASGPAASSVPPIESVEGRLDDAIVRPDGAIVTTGAIDRQLGAVSLRAYQVVQRAPDAATIEVVGGSPEAAKEALAPLLAGVKLEARASTSIPVEPNGKYRTTVRQFPLSLSDAFGGCVQ